MSNSFDVYDLCRHFINDNQAAFSGAELNVLHGLVRARDFRRLANITSEFTDHLVSVQRTRLLLQIQAFFKKNADFRDDAQCKLAAVESFERGERICRITNRRLDYYFSKRERIAPDLRLLIAKSEAFIAKALGCYDDFLNELPAHLKITSGATSALPRKRSLPPLKLTRVMDCLPTSKPYLAACARYFGYAVTLESTTCNRVEFVAKSWKTDRTIACEPTGTLPFQLAFDSYCKQRLRRYNCDLRDQTVSQRHAYLGSVEANSFATIDLSMASDTVAFNTVAWLLPADWFNYLRDHRSPQYRMDSDIGTYAKFSSMGNGATFALETLVFLSFVRAAGCSDGMVYGDDITCKPHAVDGVLRLLRFFGFVPNVEKSFTSGPFRESCGKHYHTGHDVTPFYVRSTDKWDIPNLCHNINGCAAISEHGEVWDYLRRLVVSNKLPLVPYNFDTMTGVFITPHHAYRAKKIRTVDHRGRYTGILHFRGYYRKARKRRIDDSRSLFLFFFRTFGGRGRVAISVLHGDALVSACITSSYSLSTEKFSLKKLVWNHPAMGCSGHLYGWSELILRAS
jgi:hypothetical protein